MQVRTPEGLLKMWRRSTRQYPFDFHVGGRRVLHTRNVLVAGPRDVYLGITGAVLGTIPTAAIYFALYEYTKTRLERRGWYSLPPYPSAPACCQSILPDTVQTVYVLSQGDGTRAGHRRQRIWAPPRWAP